MRALFLLIPSLLWCQSLTTVLATPGSSVYPPITQPAYPTILYTGNVRIQGQYYPNGQYAGQPFDKTIGVRNGNMNTSLLPNISGAFWNFTLIDGTVYSCSLSSASPVSFYAGCYLAPPILISWSTLTSMQWSSMSPNQWYALKP